MTINAEKISKDFSLERITNKTPEAHSVNLFGETYYQIENYDAMPPFFMSIVSSGDHWLFISSNGGLTAGRVDANQALFPYYTEDKITDNNDHTGSKSIFRVTKNEEAYVWEPLTDRHCGQYDFKRNLYKNVTGTSIVFEEVNHTLGLRYRYAWRTSEKFGFVRTIWIENTGSIEHTLKIELLDGIQNFLPANVTASTQNDLSCLLDAYKRSEIDLSTGLGVFSLNSTLTDLAEPSESLLATTVFQVGLTQVDYLLSSSQLERFRSGMRITPENDVRGRRGAYFIHTTILLNPGQELSWHIVADTYQDWADIVDLFHVLKSNPEDLDREIEQDIKANTAIMHRIVASADGWQISADKIRTFHHYANVMFNVMRGGIFAEQYWIDTDDFKDFVFTHLRQVLETHSNFFAALPKKILVSDLHALVDKNDSSDLTRLGYTYLPLTFSRRHGDPSRPWNKFAINIRKTDGSVRLNYEGNWRDIFQNWEALAYSFPEFIEGMILTFLSATTIDGYNPYRITRSGLDWEIPEPGNPWANIGYWSDHQIIYLLKLMEISERVHPGRLGSFLNRLIISYANIPYRIKPYPELIKDPYNTIQFDHSTEKKIDDLVEKIGTDGKLVLTSDDQVLHSSLVEKMLTLLLAKLVNFVPEGGIWMNTQRPEWNDANNALVGKGLSVVTLSYLRRYIVFCHELFSKTPVTDFQIRQEILGLFEQVKAILERFEPNLAVSFDDIQRRAMMDALGLAGSDYRWNVYRHGLSFELDTVSREALLTFLKLAQRHIEHSLRANQRRDNLYHTYNILHIGEDTSTISHLQEMLEGQVAILSSGMLSGEESLELLRNLRNSSLYCNDRNTYLLYPDKILPGFLAKNSLKAEQVKGLQLPALLANAHDKSLFVRDIHGIYHFSGELHNIKDVNKALENLGKQPQYSALVNAEREKISALFEDTFRHNEFTGRSGTFFAYEGLGSIYWHMVSKLLLAVQETVLSNQHESCILELVEKYHEISSGLGFNKSPSEFGAFPTDPYSHSPKGQGARQPGMTGVVKEEVIARQAEVGLVIENGHLTFNSFFINPRELLAAPDIFEYQDVNGKQQQINLAPGCMVFTFCETPFVIQLTHKAHIEVHKTDGEMVKIDGDSLDAENSQHIFHRDGTIHHLVVFVNKPSP